VLGGEHDEHRRQMLAAVRRQVAALLNGYLGAE